MKKPFEIAGDEFEELVLNADKPVVVDFWAAWCGPCLMMAPVLDELADELGEVASFAKLNVDDYPEISHEFGVGGIPTLIVFWQGEEAARLTGFSPKPVLRNELDGILASQAGIEVP